MEPLDLAYHERNRCVALLARMARAMGFSAGISQDPHGEEGWRTVIFIDLPAGQVSWHIPDRERHLFHFLPPYTGQWDGHDTDLKYQRCAEPQLDADL